ncbi:transcriptional regulator [Pandoraea terrae]|uniref:Transcriptional regulator n=1 Tax=Pandoraea terrae TaxID=1537710 RepID=A0A5E4UB29_9BURK|nr:AlpA family transcriptional regulator [Pandoraea terrae]VVD97250.1 transcriptional regulator [Pandoraea terrae]
MLISSRHSLLRLPDVIAQVGLSRSSLYRLLATGDFPAPVKIGIRSVAWRAFEVDEWVASRPSRTEG